ncbi:DUF4097 family beta strand repeat-containing protein [Actinoplanes awajinensis]|uniref:DUF4097 domain-containing protein n=1 Tax=Actinoplanes awajinensis subsp. mycoplanecinus TaxID=135947 RepID=A0A117MPK9_9ACTN|nr:DUF4097 family beta strand repeat-containing protein [Actinoplanes awajinensis]KUL28794.1 hypothetical protein ADL15_30920 [Actinoplanes awajinensis subsp. mycoplanecinus]
MQQFATTSPITAVLDIPAGRIQFIAADRADTTVEIRPADAAKGRDVKAAEQITVDYRDGVLRIETPAPQHKLLGNSGVVEVTVQLPAGSRVEAKTAAGEVRGVGRLGDVTVEGAQGSIELDESAAASLTLLHGDITVGRLTGSAQITTQHGDIRVAEAVAGALVLRTQSGNISADAARGVSASLDAGTTHGRIRNALSNTGGAGVTIQATTAHGDITARSL